MGEALKHGSELQPRIRRVDNLLIIVKNRDTVYVFAENAKGHITFHRWFQGAGSFSRWDLFTRRLMRNKHLTVSQCFALANRNEIEYEISTAPVEVMGRVIISATQDL